MSTCLPSRNCASLHHVTGMVFLVRDPSAIIVLPVKPFFDSASLSDWWEVTHILLLPLYASIRLLFKCQFKSVSFSPQNLLDRIGSVYSKPMRTHTHAHTDKAHHSQCNYHAVWLYTAFNNPCVSYSAMYKPCSQKSLYGELSTIRWDPFHSVWIYYLK